MRLLSEAEPRPGASRFMLNKTGQHRELVAGGHSRSGKGCFLVGEGGLLGRAGLGGDKTSCGTPGHILSHFLTSSASHQAPQICVSNFTGIDPSIIAS